MTSVLHTAKICSVDSIMFVNGIRTKKSTEEKNEKKHGRAAERGIRRSEVRFLMYHLKKKIFFCPTLVTRRKPSFSISLSSSKLTIFLFLLKLIDLGYR